METTPITSAAPAAAPASTPAAGSPSPVSSPAASTTPAAPASPAVSPSTSTPDAPPVLDSDARQQAMVEAFNKSQGEKPAEVAAETPKPVEAPAEETPAAETPKPDAEVEAPAAQDTEDYSFDEESPVGARDLAAKIDADPALKAALPAEIRNEILANARIAERLAPYEQIFASPEEAKVIAETANEYSGLSEAYSLVARDVEKGTSALVSKLIEGSALRDADGNIRKDENGNILTDGTAGKFLDKIFERGFALKVAKKVESLNDENVSAAFDLVMESVGLRPSTADQDQNADPALAARKAELDAQEARIRTERQTATTEAYKQHQSAVDGESLSQFQTALTGLLGHATALTPLEQSAVEGKINAAFSAALKRGNPTSTAYYQRLDRIRQEPLSATRRQKEVALAAQFTRENLVRIARPIFKEAGVSVGKKAEERAAAQTAREQAARSEVGGGSAPAPATVGTGDAAQQQARAVDAFKAANGGRAPEGEAEMRVGMMLAHAKSRGIAA
jgi:hypothetical protein